SIVDVSGAEILVGCAIEYIGGIGPAHCRHVRRSGEGVGIHTGPGDHAAVETRIGAGIAAGNEYRDAFGIGLGPHQVDGRLAGAVHLAFAIAVTGADDVRTTTRCIDQVVCRDEDAAEEIVRRVLEAAVIVGATGHHDVCTGCHGRGVFGI